MTALLEKKILSALLDDLEIIKRLPLSVRWFEDQEHRQLADVDRKSTRLNSSH